MNNNHNFDYCYFAFIRDERLQLSVGVGNIVGLQKKVHSLEAENFKLIRQVNKV